MIELNFHDIKYLKKSEQTTASKAFLALRLHRHEWLCFYRGAGGRYNSRVRFFHLLLVKSEGLTEIVGEASVDVVILDPLPVIVVVEVLVVVVSPGPRDAPDVPHERLVGGSQPLVGHLPTPVAEVVEAHLVATEVGALLHATNTAESVLEVRVNLDDEY